MLKRSLIVKRLPPKFMKYKLYILFIVMGLSIFTYNSDSQNGPGVGAYTSVPNKINAGTPVKEFVKKKSIYCNTGGKSIAHGWIEEVTVGQYEFVSGSNSGYVDLSNREFDIECGSFNAFDIKSGQSNSSNKHNWRVWIDYNKDGDYDKDEQVISNYSVHMKGLVFIPARSRLTYRTGMRIAMNKDDIPKACGIFENGEVEDYTVVLKIAEEDFVSKEVNLTTDIQQRISSHRINVYPNPAKLDDPIIIDFATESASEVNLSIFSIDGRLVETGVRNAIKGNNKLNIEGMITENGVYLIKMQIGAKSFIKKITIIE